jgi:hypothetical protein
VQGGAQAAPIARPKSADAPEKPAGVEIGLIFFAGRVELAGRNDLILTGGAGKA